jgi:hypothetical protein
VLVVACGSESSARAISLVAALFLAVKDAASRLAALGPFGPSLTARLSSARRQGTSPQGATPASNINSASQSTTCATSTTPHWCKEPAHKHNRALRSPTIIHGALKKFTEDDAPGLGVQMAYWGFFLGLLAATGVRLDPRFRLPGHQLQHNERASRCSAQSPGTLPSSIVSKPSSTGSSHRRHPSCPSAQRRCA